MAERTLLADRNAPRLRDGARPAAKDSPDWSVMI